MPVLLGRLPLVRMESVRLLERELGLVRAFPVCLRRLLSMVLG